MSPCTMRPPFTANKCNKTKKTKSNKKQNFKAEVIQKRSLRFSVVCGRKNVVKKLQIKKYNLIKR